MTDAPEQIWAWDFIDSRQEEGIIRGGWDDSFDRKATQYTRTDIAQKAGWQPIETAPKDGTVILVWRVAKLNGHAAFDSNIKQALYLVDLDEWQVESVGGNVPPTLSHWMPLPAAPALVTQGEE